MSNTPRYIVSASLVSDAPKYEFPIQSMTGRSPIATLVVETEQGFPKALLTALQWAEQFSQRQRYDVYPKVRYSDSLRMIKKVVGTHAWAESGTHGAWVPVGSLSL